MTNIWQKSFAKIAPPASSVHLAFMLPILHHSAAVSFYSKGRKRLGQGGQDRGEIDHDPTAVTVGQRRLGSDFHLEIAGCWPERHVPTHHGVS